MKLLKEFFFISIRNHYSIIDLLNVGIKGIIIFTIFEGLLFKFQSTKFNVFFQK